MEIPHIKRPPNDYMLFSAKYRGQIKKEHPEMSGPDVTRELGKRWQTISAEEKAPFVAKAQRLKDKIKRKYPNYKSYTRKKLEKMKRENLLDPAPECSKQEQLVQMSHDSTLGNPQNQMTQFGMHKSTTLQATNFNHEHVAENYFSHWSAPGCSANQTTHGMHTRPSQQMRGYNVGYFTGDYNFNMPAQHYPAYEMPTPLIQPSYYYPCPFSFFDHTNKESKESVLNTSAQISSGLPPSSTSGSKNECSNDLSKINPTSCPPTSPASTYLFL